MLDDCNGTHGALVYGYVSRLMNCTHLRFLKEMQGKSA